LAIESQLKIEDKVEIPDKKNRAFMPASSLFWVSCLLGLTILSGMIVLFTQSPSPVHVVASTLESEPTVLLQNSAPSWLVNLHRFGLDEQLAALQKAKDLGARRTAGAAQWAQLLRDCDSKTDHRVIASLLYLVRREGKSTVELSEAVSSLLPYQADIYPERDKWHVLRLRAYTFSTLSDIGFTQSAMPMLTDALAYVDERMSALEFGAVARLVGTMGEKGRPFIPHLLGILGERFAEEEFSLERYELEFPRKEATTVQIEVLRSLAGICNSKDEQALTVLNSILNTSKQSSMDPRLQQEAKKSLDAINARTESENPIKWFRSMVQKSKSGTLKAENAEESRSIWQLPNQRLRLLSLDVATVIDQEGETYPMSRLADKPILLVFFYTRCQNARKCAATIAQLAMLQREMIARGWEDKARLIAITFEPEFDTPKRLKQFTVDYGMVHGSNARAISIEEKSHNYLLKELDTPVCYNSGWVNSHGIEAVLLDANGRIARKYSSLGWDNTVVLDDFQHLFSGQ